MSRVSVGSQAANRRRNLQSLRRDAVARSYRHPRRIARGNKAERSRAAVRQVHRRRRRICAAALNSGKRNGGLRKRQNRFLATQVSGSAAPAASRNEKARGACTQKEQSPIHLQHCEAPSEGPSTRDRTMEAKKVYPFK